jgi:hypothetical protein
VHPLRFRRRVLRDEYAMSGPPPDAPEGRIITNRAFAATSIDASLIHMSLESRRRFIDIVDTLPALPSANYPEGSVVFLTTDDKLYRNTGSAWTTVVTSDDIAANAIIAGKIDAAAGTARELATGAVTTEKLTVGVLSDSVLLNAGFEEADSADATLPAQWSRGFAYSGTGVVRTLADKKSGVAALLLPYSGGVANDSGPLISIPVAPGDVWYVSCWAKADAVGTTVFYAGAWGGTTNRSVTTHLGWFVAAAVNVPNAWTKYEGQVTIPAGVTYMTVDFLNYIGKTVGVYVDDITTQKAVGSASIISLTASKISAGILSAVTINGGAPFTDLEGTFYPIVINAAGGVTINGSENFRNSLVFHNTLLSGDDVQVFMDSNARFHIRQAADAINSPFSVAFLNTVGVGMQLDITDEANQTHALSVNDGAGVFLEDWMTRGGLGILFHGNLRALASTTNRASLRMPHGSAPTGINIGDGDMWTTTAGLFVRINGVTKTVTLT